MLDRMHIVDVLTDVAVVIIVASVATFVHMNTEAATFLCCTNHLI